MPFRPSQRDHSSRVCCSHQSHFGIRVALCASTNLLLPTSTFLTCFIQYLPLYKRKRVSTIISLTASWLLLKISDHLLFFKYKNGLISIDVREYLRYLRTRKFDIYNDNFIYRHNNQNYYRKSYSLEFWTLELVSILYKNNPLFSSFKTSHNNIYLSKCETYNPHGCYWYMSLV